MQKRHNSIADELVLCLFYINSLWSGDTIWQQLKISVNIGSGDGLLPDGTKPLPEPMLTYHKYIPVTITWGQFHIWDPSAINY